MKGSSVLNILGKDGWMAYLLSIAIAPFVWTAFSSHTWLLGACLVLLVMAADSLWRLTGFNQRVIYFAAIPRAEVAGCGQQFLVI
jgi:hypothetical protein